MATGALPQHQFERYPWLKSVALLEKPNSNSALLSIVEKVLNEEKDIPNVKVDPRDFASAKFDSAPPEIISENGKTDQAEASSDQAAARSDRAEAPSEAAEIRNIAALRSSEIRYRRLFEAAKDGILILNVDT